MRRAKIVCTLGPASASREVIADLIRAGMDTARLNFSHGSHEEHRALAETVRAEAARQGRAVALLQDLSGPKMRVGRLPGGAVTLVAGEEVTLFTGEASDDPRRIPQSYAGLAADVRPGHRILLDDGRLALEVREARDGEVRCVVRDGGVLTDHKGLNLPGVRISAPAITDKDRADLAFGVALGVDYVALSFVRDAREVRQAIALAPGVPMIAKIEKPEAVQGLEGILEVAHGIMVARGDLGVEIGVERVPLLQKRLIEATNRRGKLVITATEMLDSMRERPRPTRAEVSDVANAVLDGTDAVMLSGETASGRYPVLAVETMDRIVREAERSARFWALPRDVPPSEHETTNAIAQAAVLASREIEARLILAYTEGGRLPTRISEHWPRARVVAVTPVEKTYRMLALRWGVTPLHIEHAPASAEETVTAMVGAARAAGLLTPGELVACAMGSRRTGPSDLLKVERVAA